MDTTSPEGEQLGVDLLLVTQVARLPGVEARNDFSIPMPQDRVLLASLIKYPKDSL